MLKLIRSISILLFGAVAIPCTLWAQSATITVTPSELQLNVGDKVQLTAVVTDENGNSVDGEIRFFSRARRDMPVSRTGEATAVKPGSYTLFALFIDEGGNRVQQEIPVEVAYPPLDRIEIANAPERIYAGESLRLNHRVLDVAGLTRDDVEVTFSVSNNRAEISQFGHFRALEPGNADVTVSAEGIESTIRIAIRQNPIRNIDITNTVMEARTGDVLRVDAVARDASGRNVDDARISYSFLAEPDDELGEGATAQIDQKGRFVANKPGFYTLVAKNGNTIEQQQVRINPRNVSRDIELVGHALVANVHTSDLWVWEGVDGRDYAITGTWGGNGEAYFWDVTDPSNIIPTDTVTVDARTVNDVKISEDGRLAVLTREGASNRRNGIVILDVTNPRDVNVVTEYTDELTGGVHNAFIYEDHVYAVNNGTRYDIINIEDPSNPYRVSRFELDTPGHSIHDVWIENGMAYSSNWSDGIVVADVGSNPNAMSPEGVEMGLGSPSNPVELARYSYPSGWNHAAFPFKSQSTGDFYVIAGDEAFPNGLYTQDRPTIPAGWIHFIKFDDWNNPEEVASYRVPEAGTHNFWVEDDILYIAYYNGGLRVVDISGELMGDLYAQGREIAHYVTTHHEGHIPNAAMAWGPQPYKGHIFVSDWNSGLWAFKLTD